MDHYNVALLRSDLAMKQRATDDTEKAARRSAILDAARRLYLEDSYQLPSAARIAEATGLAKGTLYLYFRTKEEIFVALLAEEFGALLRLVHEVFSEAAIPAPAQFLARFVEHLDRHPELLRLDAMAYSVLEQNLSEPQLRTFKLELTQGLVAAGGLLDRALHLPQGRGTTLLMRTYALTRGLWQSLDYPPAMRAVLADPVFAPIRPAFRSELAEALAEYWRGALPT